MRAWIEHGFKLLKSAGWQWQTTRMTDPGRAERLWLVLAVATRYVLAVGGEVEAVQELPVETIPELASTAAQAPRAGHSASARRRQDQSRRHARRPKSEPAAPRLRASGTKQRWVSVF